MSKANGPMPAAAARTSAWIITAAGTGLSAATVTAGSPMPCPQQRKATSAGSITAAGMGPFGFAQEPPAGSYCASHFAGVFFSSCQIAR